MVFKEFSARGDARNRVGRAIFTAAKTFTPAIIKWYKDQYDKEQSKPQGITIPWRPLKQSTLDWRRKIGKPYPTYKMLNISGKLRNSIKVKPKPTGFTIFTNVDYGKYQNPNRPFIYASRDVEQAFAQHAANLIALQLNNMKWQ
jgi:hypothetical protein